MKKNIYITVIMLFVLFVSSCSDFLEETPLDVKGVDNFYEVPAHAEDAITAVYNNWADLFNQDPQSSQGGGVYFMYDYIAGKTTGTAAESHVPDVTRFINLQQQSDAIHTNIRWTTLYSIIGRANAVFKYVPQIEMDETRKNQIYAEARFFRAYAYFHLVRTFGGVPKIIEAYTSTEEDFFIPRSTVSEIYNDVIVADLIEAEKGGLSVKDAGGRVTLSAVKALLSKVYLTMAGFPLEDNTKYALALAKAKEVIDGGSYSLFDHTYDNNDSIIVSAYAKTRDETFDNTVDNIFMVQIAKDIKGTNIPLWYETDALDGHYKRGLSNFETITIDDDYIKAYDATIDYRIMNEQMYHNSYTYVGRDKKDKNDSTITVEFNHAVYKYYDEDYFNGDESTDKGIPDLRMTDVYLIAAEAAYASGGDGDSYLKPILERAYDRDNTSTNADAILVAASNKEQLVWAERYRELAYENGGLWFDILRTRQYPTTIASPTDGAAGVPDRVVFNNLIGSINGRDITYSTKDLLMPIPEEEMQKNPKLTPNPGY